MIIVTMTNSGQYETNADTWELHEGNLLLKYQGKVTATLAAGQWEGVFEVDEPEDFQAADSEVDAEALAEELRANPDLAGSLADALERNFVDGFCDGRP
jgi:hypothetical protein